MGFGSAKKVAIPPAPEPIPIPPPAPTPEEMTPEARRKAEAKRRKLMAAKGRAGTILTEETLGEAGQGYKTLLSGSR